MARLSFLYEYEKLIPPVPPATGPAQLVKVRSTFSCIPRVAAFLGLLSEAYTPKADDKIDRAGYTREYTTAAGTKATVTVQPSKTVYSAYGKPNAKLVVLKTGVKTANGNFTKLALTFPSSATPFVIADQLGEFIPAEKIAALGVTPTATQIEPFFVHLGKKKYAIPTKAEATATAEPKAALDPAGAVVVLQETVSLKKKK